MSKDYLPIKESLGYRNVKAALQKVFSVNLDDIDIRGGEYEGFGFYLTYNNIAIHIGIFDTGKGVQFQAGEGGIFSITLPNPKYPDHSFLKKVSLSYLIANQKVSEKLRWCLGRNEEDVEYALRVLKDYLDSDDAKVLLKNE